MLSGGSDGSRPHIKSLDGLRGLAILMVFSYHGFRANLLWMGVDLFFILSGFLITGVLLGEKSQSFASYIRKFYVRRIRRILPAYAAILVIASCLFGTAWLQYWYLYLGGMNFLTPLGLPTLRVFPLWSLAVEEQFYLVWPIAVFFLSKRKLALLCGALLILTPLLRLVFAPYLSSGYATYMLTPFRMDTLATGALLAIVWPELQRNLASASRLKQKLLIRAGTVFFFSLAIALFLNAHDYRPANGERVGSTLLLESTLVMTAMLFLMALIDVGQRILCTAPLRFMGRISYSFYLFHLIAIAIVPKNNAFLAFGLSLTYSTLMWLLVEGPILHQKPSLAIGKQRIVERST